MQPDDINNPLNNRIGELFNYIIRKLFNYLKR